MLSREGTLRDSFIAPQRQNEWSCTTHAMAYLVCLICYGAGWLIIMGVTTYLFFPETAGVSVENAHAVFRDHWFWSKAYPEVKEVRLLAPLPHPISTSSCRREHNLHNK